MNLPSSNPIPIEKGYCYLADMNPPRRSKSGKVRPVIVIQASDILTAGSPGVAVIPLTTNLMDENILRVHIKPTTGLSLTSPSDALVDQIHTIDKSLILESLGPIPPDLMEKIFEGIKFLLGI